MKIRIGLIVVALSLSACSSLVASQRGDASGQALAKDRRAGVVSECDRESRRFWTPSRGGLYDSSRADIDADIQRMLYRECLRKHPLQAP